MQSSLSLVNTGPSHSEPLCLSSAGEQPKHTNIEPFKEQTFLSLKLHTSLFFFSQKMSTFSIPLKTFTHFILLCLLKRKKLIKLQDPFEFRKCWQCWKERHSAFQSSGGEEKKILNKTILCDFAGGLSYHFICTFVPLLIGMFI